MKSKLLHEDSGQRVFAVILDPGDEVMSCLQRFAADEDLGAAQVSAIGAFRSATLAFWDRQRKDYEKHKVDEQTEVLSLLGDISVEPSGAPRLHLHAVLGRRDTQTIGGHLVAGEADPTLELIVTEQPAYLRRVFDDKTGLATIKL